MSPGAAPSGPLARVPGYLMEGPREVERLESKTDGAAARAQLELVGLAPGMRALDAGAGSGAVARVMAERVGPSGRVVALDGSAARCRAGARLAHDVPPPGVSFVVGDAGAPPLRPGAFDFVWSRFLFEYLPEPDRVLRVLAGLVRPGGKLVVGDLDGNAVFHYPVPPALEAGLPRLQAALRGRFDPYAGRKLYTRFRRAGLRDVRVHLLPYHLHTGAVTEATLGNWRAKLEALRAVGAAALGGVEAFAAFERAFLDHLRDPESLTYSVLFLVEGVRPDTGGAP